jgi:hypothetical protein
LKISKQRIKEIAENGFIYASDRKGSREGITHSYEAQTMAKQLLKLLDEANDGCTHGGREAVRPV